MDEKRVAVLLGALLLATVVGTMAYQFIAPLTIAVFLYYSTRRYFQSLRQFGLPARVRAVAVIASIAVPLLVLVSYALVLLALEAQLLVEEYAFVDLAAAQLEGLDALESTRDLSVQGVVDAYRSGQLSPLIAFVSERATLLTAVLSDFFLNLFVTVILTYYFLLDGGRIRTWLLEFDSDGVLEEYVDAVDAELEAVLLGNLLNVVAISLIAMAAFTGYNVVAPEAVEVPYPTLAGALTGIASLVPVVGMKIVYLPLTVVAASPVLVGGQTSLWPYIVGFLAVAVVIVDVIPDFLLRPILSGEETHVGLLMLAYTLGPVILGFYGLFLAPVVLVAATTFATTTLPRVLGAAESQGGTADSGDPNQRRLTEFE